MKHVYAKLDMTHPLYGDAIAAAEAGFKARLPNNSLSITTNVAQTECWVKLVTDDVEALRAASADYMACVLDTAEDYGEHRAKVTAEVRAWDAERENA